MTTIPLASPVSSAVNRHPWHGRCQSSAEHAAADKASISFAAPMATLSARAADETCAKELILWTHVMMQAVEDAKRRRYDAVAWITSDRQGVGTFRWICGLTKVELSFARAQALNQVIHRKPTQKRVR